MQQEQHQLACTDNQDSIFGIGPCPFLCHPWSPVRLCTRNSVLGQVTWYPALWVKYFSPSGIGLSVLDTAFFVKSPFSVIKMQILFNTLSKDHRPLLLNLRHCESDMQSYVYTSL
ncbi:hypothetical protein PILCRDRAFT_823766, partial [Piloderma croceum F 1598]